MEGHEHKVQRKLIAPAFTAQSIRELAPIFYSKAEELCDLWASEEATPADSDKQTGPDRFTVDVTVGLGRAVFDAMGLGGFDYDFNSLKDASRPDHQPYRKMFRIVDQGISPRDIVDLYLPFLRKLWVSRPLLGGRVTDADPMHSQATRRLPFANAQKTSMHWGSLLLSASEPISTPTKKTPKIS